MFKLVIANLGFEKDLSEFEKEYNTLKEVKVAVNKITNNCRRKALDNFKIEYDNTEFKEELFDKDGVLYVLHAVEDQDYNIYIRKIEH